MRPAMFRDMTHTLGAPEGWDETRDGPCGGLPVQYDRENRQITSCWVLEPGDIELLQAGGRVYLTVCGLAQPPVALTVKVEETPEPLQGAAA